MNSEWALVFAARWARGWNDHDLEAVLSHYAEGIVFTSPLAAQMREGSDGTIRGKTALRDYWSEGLRRMPDLHFEVLGVYVGVDTLVINFRNQAGRLGNEVLVLDGPLITSGRGTYLQSSANPPR